MQIDGVGKLRFWMTEAMTGRLRSVSVSCDVTGRWHASFTADGVPLSRAPDATAAVDSDLGLKHTVAIHDFADTSKRPAPKHFAAQQARLRRYQRSDSRKLDAAMCRQGLDPCKHIRKGTRIGASQRMRHSKARIGRLHARVVDLRRGHQHRLPTHVVNSAAVIAIEDLKLKDRSHTLESISWTANQLAPIATMRLRERSGFRGRRMCGCRPVSKRTVFAGPSQGVNTGVVSQAAGKTPIAESAMHSMGGGPVSCVIARFPSRNKRSDRIATLRSKSN